MQSDNGREQVGKKTTQLRSKKDERKDLDTRERKNLLRVVMGDPYC